ncbi:MAG: hypothetical protein JJ714_10680, partial [Acidithiobacillus sp.]|nr:hypothetical protein [Acidithiobacillus sp.]
MSSVPATAIESLINKIQSLIDADLIPNENANTYKGGMAYVLGELKLLLPKGEQQPVIQQSLPANEEEPATQNTLVISKEDDKEAIDTIAAIMIAQGCTNLSIEYNGAGDSMDCLEISYHSAPLDEDQKEQILKSAGTLIESFHYCFWDNDGGRGMIEFTLTDTL